MPWLQLLLHLYEYFIEILSLRSGCNVMHQVLQVLQLLLDPLLGQVELAHHVIVLLTLLPHDGCCPGCSCLTDQSGDWNPPLRGTTEQDRPATRLPSSYSSESLFSIISSALCILVWIPVIGGQRPGWIFPSPTPLFVVRCTKKTTHLETYLSSVI